MHNLLIVQVFFCKFKDQARPLKEKERATKLVQEALILVEK
jgi:hypothetical protein